MHFHRIWKGVGLLAMGFRETKTVRSRDVVFHEHETIEDMETIVRGKKLTYEGVADLTLG